MSEDDETITDGAGTTDEIPVSRPELTAMIEAAVERALTPRARPAGTGELAATPGTGTRGHPGYWCLSLSFKGGPSLVACVGGQLINYFYLVQDYRRWARCPR